MVVGDRHNVGSLAQHLCAALTCDPTSEDVTVEARAGFVAIAETINIYRAQNTKQR